MNPESVVRGSGTSKRGHLNGQLAWDTVLQLIGQQRNED